MKRDDIGPLADTLLSPEGFVSNTSHKIQRRSQPRISRDDLEKAVEPLASLLVLRSKGSMEQLKYLIRGSCQAATDYIIFLERAANRRYVSHRREESNPQADDCELLEIVPATSSVKDVYGDLDECVAGSEPFTLIYFSDHVDEEIAWKRSRLFRGVALSVPVQLLCALPWE